MLVYTHKSGVENYQQLKGQMFEHDARVSDKVIGNNAIQTNKRKQNILKYKGQPNQAKTPRINILQI